jgi:hypothetical protein
MKYLFISLCLLLAVGCQRETTVKEVVETGTSASKQRSLMDELQFAMEHPVQTRAAGPANPNNPFDHMGDYQRGILMSLNEIQEGPQAARNREEYMEQLSNLFEQNPAPSLNVEGAPEPIEKEIYNAALNVFTGQFSIDQKIGTFISMENVIRSSNALGLPSKERMLSLISSFKYVAYTIGTDGLLFNGNLLLPGAWWDCWDQQFSYHVGKNMSDSLWSWDDSPVQTALSWIGLGATIVGSVVDGAIQASNDC